MDIKAFAAGAVLGATVVAAAVWTSHTDLTREQSAQQAGASVGRDQERADLPAIGRQSLSGSSGTRARPTEAIQARAAVSPTIVAPMPRPPSATVSDKVEPGPDSAPVSATASLSDSERETLESRWLADEYAKLLEEPKSDTWAYQAEQAMVQFLANHPLMLEFDVSYIECRTTLCQIRVSGFDESAGPSWQRIMYDMRQEPWSEIGSHGTSSTSIDGRLVIIANLYRSAVR